MSSANVLEASDWSPRKDVPTNYMVSYMSFREWGRPRRQPNYLSYRYFYTLLTREKNAMMKLLCYHIKGNWIPFLF